MCYGTTISTQTATRRALPIPSNGGSSLQQQQMQLLAQQQGNGIHAHLIPQLSTIQEQQALVQQAPGQYSAQELAELKDDDWLNGLIGGLGAGSNDGLNDGTQQPSMDDSTNSFQFLVDDGPSDFIAAGAQLGLYDLPGKKQSSKGSATSSSTSSLKRGRDEMNTPPESIHSGNSSSGGDCYFNIVPQAVVAQNPLLFTQGHTSHSPKETELAPEQKTILKRQKNTEAARQSRFRKQQKLATLEEQVAELERQNAQLQTENLVLKSENKGLGERIGGLEKQVQELHGVVVAFGRANAQ